MFKHLSSLSHRAAWSRQLELILDSAGEGIYGIDLSGRCIFMNRTGANMLGYTPDEVLGRNMHYLMHHSYSNRDLMPVCECKIFQAFKLGEGCRVDSEVLWRRDGTSFHAEYASYPIVVEGETLGAVVTFNDITERVEANRSRIAAQVELERRVQERTHELATAHERVRKLSSHLNLVREQERAHLAREIHDDLGTQLTAITMSLNAILHRYRQDELLSNRLTEVLQLSTQAMGALRGVLNDLRPGVLDHFGLWAAAEHLLKETAQRTGLAVELSVARHLDGVRLGRSMETALYRILQEMLNNTLKHAQAQTFVMMAWQLGSTLCVRFEDDGLGVVLREGARGLCSASTGSGFGLMGIEERVWDMGGTCRFESHPGQGFGLDIELPNVLSTSTEGVVS